MMGYVIDCALHGTFSDKKTKTYRYSQDNNVENELKI